MINDNANISMLFYSSICAVGFYSSGCAVGFGVYFYLFIPKLYTMYALYVKTL